MKKTNKKPAPRYPSWNTTDDYEIDLRKARALNEPMDVKHIDNGERFFSDYIVSRKDTDNPRKYKVELRSLQKRFNYCTCPDFKKNSLGTCKHIEKLLYKASSSKGRSPFIEIFCDFSQDARLVIELPDNPDETAVSFLSKYLDISESFKKPIENTLQVFLRDHENAPQDIKRRIRVSDAVHKLAARLKHQQNNRQIQEKYAAQLRKSAGEADFLRYPLYDYQIDGMLHLAFTERAMLADEMGLGKTVQAVAAANVLKNLHDIKRVLVICPASLKTEWEEQISKFTGLSATLLYGSRKDRLGVYKNCRSFFLLTNYEQVLRDFDEVNQYFSPDLIILDEAQRIKNWKTKTARSIKELQSRFAFVLTGTPLENKIDELYSIVDFIDHTVFGSLFRFNREYYNFDEDGKTSGFKNLRKLHEKVQPVMMRRRKDEIAEQLPERIDNNYFVELSMEQRARYGDYEYKAAMLMAIAKTRPLTPEEYERLQLMLACMRMLCDTCYILDSKITDSPKVDELLKILTDIWENDPDRKVIIFSEWVKMLELVKVQLEENKVDFGWHVGAVPQKKRRVEINKFKNDINCKVFLSSDSGGLGLNLQAASVVINLDLPWNPAKLEQRIARAWRKHQKNTVNVINLVAEQTIEHNMLATLDYKQGLADGVIDGRGDIELIEKPNAKNAFVERLAQLMKTTVAKSVEASSDIAMAEANKPMPSELFEQEIKLDAGRSTKLCSSIVDETGREIKTVFAVSNNVDETVDHLADVAARTNTNIQRKDITVVDVETYKLLRSLAEKGLISINEQLTRELFKTESITEPRPGIKEQKIKMARGILARAERKLKMANFLYNGGFEEEAILPAEESIGITANALSVLAMNEPPSTEPEKFDVSILSSLKTELNLNDDYILLIRGCCDSGAKNDIDYVARSTGLIFEANRIINEMSL